MNTELEELKAQKRELEKRIKEMENNGCLRAGRAEISVEHFPTNLPDRWHLSISVDSSQYNNLSSRQTKRTIVNAKTKEQIIEAIPSIICDLDSLYKKATGQEKQTSNWIEIKKEDFIASIKKSIAQERQTNG